MTGFFKEVVSLWGLGSYSLLLGLMLVGETYLEEASAGITPFPCGPLGSLLSPLGGKRSTWRHQPYVHEHSMTIFMCI